MLFLKIQKHQGIIIGRLIYSTFRLRVKYVKNPKSAVKKSLKLCSLSLGQSGTRSRIA